ncbi:MAG TPA: NADH-quinone oxidoreductase subunit M [Cyclobacteriaceae bacterium]|nr:NADH-quinone oxidoreductase subunit M [Cyclobacteriaceae bacterium]
MITVFLIIFPMFMFLLMVGMRHRRPRLLALIGALVEFVVSVYAWVNFQSNSEVQFAYNEPWLSGLGMRLSVGLDGISLPLVLLTTTLIPLIILSSSEKNFSRPSLFYGLVLLMQSALVGVFTSFDVLLFYVFWELALIPIYLICLIWGSEKEGKVTIKFFIYTLAGSLVMLVGIIYVFMSVKPGLNQGFDIDSFMALGRNLDPQRQGLIFWMMFAAFAIKMPVFPFHTWQPSTYTYAPTQGTMLLSGIMLKMGIYGVIRWLIPLVPLGVAEWGSTALVLSVIGVVYASVIALVQNNMKTLVAYSSIAHVGLISAGVFTQSEIGIQGAMIQMFSHGLVVFGLFYVIDIIQQKAGTADLKDLGGIRNVAPKFTTAFVVIMLGSVALPLTSGFVGEFLLINSLVQYQIWIGAVAGLTIILGAVYMLVMFQRAMSGEAKAVTLKFTDLSTREKIVLYPVVILIILIGVYPAPLLSISEPAVSALVSSLVELTSSLKP